MLNSLVDIFLRMLNLKNGLISHNIAKNKAIGLIFWWSAVESVQGDYVEFGVATGNSLRGAELAEKRAFSKKLSIPKIHRRIFGFDTFGAFSSEAVIDLHSNWSGSSFSDEFQKVNKRFKKSDNVKLFQVDVLDFQSSLDLTKENIFPTEIEKIAIAMFDMDLYQPTRVALECVYTRLDVGSILIFDEYFGFKGNHAAGEALAFSEFLGNHNNLKVRQFINYGMGGTSFIVSEK